MKKQNQKCVTFRFIGFVWITCGMWHLSLFLILSSICFVIRNHLFSTVPTLLVKQHFSEKPAEKRDDDVFATVYWQCAFGKSGTDEYRFYLPTLPAFMQNR